MYMYETTHANVHLWLKHAIRVCVPVISWWLCNNFPKTRYLFLIIFRMTLLGQRCWTRCPTVIPSNLAHSMILGTDNLDSCLRL